jgi:hypothetical protein
MQHLARAATTALVVGCVVVGSSWSSVAVASSAPPLVFVQPATNVKLASSSRIFDASAGDASGTRTVLYGGEAPGVNAAWHDTWVNEPDGTWRPTCGTAIAGAKAPCGPGARAGLGMADAPGGVILYGGFANSIGDGGGNPPAGDTWKWNGATWSRVCTAATCGPGARALMAMAGNGSSAVMFGGLGESGSLADTWVFDGHTWTQTCGQSGSPCGPPGLAAASMAWDGDHYVLFGGADLNGSGVPVDDTWIFDGARWTKVCGTSMGRACGPTARALASFAFANNPNPALRGAVLAEGGDIFGSGTTQHLDRDAWFFDGARWSQLTPPWNGAPVYWTNSGGSPPAGPDPLLGTMAAKPGLCQVVYLGAAVTVSADQPTLHGKTYVVGRPVSGCAIAAAKPVAQPVSLPAAGAADPSAAPAAAGPSLAMTGPYALVGSSVVALFLIASGLLLLVVSGSRRRVAV